MTSAEFDRQFVRLAAHFHLPQDERETLTADWFGALKHYHVEAFEHAVTELTRTSTDRFWPALGRVRELITTRIGRYDRTPGKCQTCHGSTWIDAPPWKSNGIIYQGVTRCPDCAVPAPKIDARSHTQSVSDVERHEYQQGRYGRDLMPEGLKAKHPERPNPEMRAQFEKLRIKLFGVKEKAS